MWGFERDQSGGLGVLDLWPVSALDQMGSARQWPEQ